MTSNVIKHSELAGRCMRAADKMRIQTEFNFLKFWAEPEAIPLCYMLFAYHQNAMICESLADADVVVEIYESEDGEPPHIMGTKDSVVYLALFKENEGIMPWLVNNDKGNISDGYHTFNELYDFRRTYNYLLFNEWFNRNIYNVHKSKKHYEGDLCFEGDYFIVCADLPDGQITNHYPIKYWDLFEIPEYDKPLSPWDGHSSNDVLNRLKGLSDG